MFHTSEMRHEIISGNEHSEHRCSLVFAVHCGIFQGSNIPVHWKYFAIETTLKMADSLNSAQTTELELIETHALFQSLWNIVYKSFGLRQLKYILFHRKNKYTVLERCEGE